VLRIVAIRWAMAGLFPKIRLLFRQARFSQPVDKMLHVFGALEK